MMLERAIEAKFVKAARERGWLALKLSGGSVIGFPDRTVLLPGGRVEFLEFKTDKGRVTRKQHFWLERLRRMGFPSWVVRSSDEAVEILERNTK